MHTEVFRILIIDDHPIVALGIKTIASKHENAECVVIHDPSLLTQVLWFKRLNVLIETPKRFV